MEIVSNSGLMPKEKQILQLLADGFDTHAVAAEVNLKPDCLRNTLVKIRNKLGADTTIQAVAMGIRRHIID